MSSSDEDLHTRTSPLTTGTVEQIRLSRPSKRRVLLLVYHRDGVEAVPLAPGAGVVIGREPPADVVIADRCLSRSHARFTLTRAEEILVEDLGSSNGTLVAGQRIERATLKPGDRVMLGSLAASIHAVADEEITSLGLEGHDAFRSALEAEIGRARFFGRQLAVLMVEPRGGGRGRLPDWGPGVRKLLRPVDRIGLYSADSVEILLPEAGLEQALELGRAIVAEGPGALPLACGIAVFPGGASSVEELIEGSRGAVHQAGAGDPVRATASEALRTVLPASSLSEGPISRSPALRPVLETAARLARSPIPVLLQGETGSGKEVLSRLIHESGPRKGKPLISVNCGAIPASLVESTLFGHERGAFTGAAQQQKGIFEAGDGGTVLLDEVGELPATVQAALLRVLETKRIVRVGSTREIEVDVRVIAATHRDLEAMCAAGTFRQDLYYRLNAMVLTLPPLRARREDIAPLAAHFLALANQSNERTIKGFDAEALALLDRYAWPGNVRELRNAVERAVVIADGDLVTPRDLPERLRAKGAEPAAPEKGAPATASTGSLKERLERFERDTLVEALRETGGNQTGAAKLLDVPLRTLQHKIKSFGIKKVYGPGAVSED
ncbi:MAG: sigma 54-interacting transcriptional regulator [Minicystis sp.]